MTLFGALRRVLAIPASALAVGLSYFALRMRPGVVPPGDASDFFLATLVALAFALIVGLPSLWLLRRFNRFTRFNVLMCAFVLGAIPIPALVLLKGNSAVVSQIPF